MHDPSLFSSRTLTFRGRNARAANDGAWPLLEPGSVTHLQAGVFTADGEDFMMTPSSGEGVAARDPGPIVLGILRDLGWTLR